MQKKKIYYFFKAKPQINALRALLAMVNRAKV